MTAHEEAVRGVLGAVYRKHGSSYLVADAANVLAAEVDEAEDGDSLEQFVRVQTMRALFADFFKEGWDPSRVMRRVYALAKAYYPELLRGFDDRTLGKMLDDTPAAQSWRRNRLVTDRLKEAGFRGTHVRCQKTETARATLSRAQMGNRNRAKSREVRAA